MTAKAMTIGAISLGRGYTAGGANSDWAYWPPVVLLLSPLGREVAQGETSVEQLNGEEKPAKKT